MPKKPIKQHYNESDGLDWFDEGILYDCPVCSTNVGKYSKEMGEWIFQEGYCSSCGQKLDWD